MPVVCGFIFILNCNTFSMAFTLGTKTVTQKHDLQKRQQ